MSGGKVHGAPFAAVPEWLLDADISDRAVRLFAVLARYADRDGRAFPGRPRLAERLRCGVSSLDRALAELVAVGAVATEAHYRADGSRAANSYWLWPAHPQVQGGTPTGEQGPPPAVGPPLPTGHAAVGNESQSTESQEHQEPGQLALVAGEAPNAGVFDRFWRAYPRKVAKGDARRAWPAAVRAAGSAEVVVAGAVRLAADPNLPTGAEVGFIPYPATWLRREGWGDPPLPPRARGGQQRQAGGPRATEAELMSRDTKTQEVRL